MSWDPVGSFHENRFPIDLEVEGESLREKIAKVLLFVFVFTFFTSMSTASGSWTSSTVLKKRSSSSQINQVLPEPNFLGDGVPVWVD